MEALARLASLSNVQLLEALSRRAAAERKAIALLVATLAEFDRRGLYRDLGYSSLFDYCTRALRLSEQATYTRIEAARASRRFPPIIDRIADGALSLSPRSAAASTPQEQIWRGDSAPANRHQIKRQAHLQGRPAGSLETR